MSNLERNEKAAECPVCGELMHVTEIGRYVYEECYSCGYMYDNEPEYDPE